MSIFEFRSVYHVAENFEASFDFYKEGLGFPLKFRDDNKWAEFRIGDARFALSSRAEAYCENAKAVAVFQATDQCEVEHRVSLFGGRLVGWRDMGSHGSVGTIEDPCGVSFQVVLPVARNK